MLKITKFTNNDIICMTKRNKKLSNLSYKMLLIREAYVSTLASPCVSAFGAAYEIGRGLISGTGLYRPPVAFRASALVAGYSCGRQGHVIAVGYDDLHFGICFPFHTVLLFNIIIGQ